MDSKSASNIEIEPLRADVGFKCPLCVDLLVSPRTLPCLHTFCGRCLELYIMDMKASARDGVIAALFCPLCKQSLALDNLHRTPREIVAELPLNKLMDNASEEFPIPGIKNLHKDKMKFVYYPQLCGLCLQSKVKVKATTYCHGCGDFRCRLCSNKHKDDRHLTDMNHDVVDIEEMSPVTASKLSEAINKYTICKTHLDQELKFYCRDHEVLLCRECDVTSHMKCRLAEDFEGLSTSLSQLKETEKLRDEMDGLQDELVFMIETLRVNNNEILEQSQSVSSKVHSMKETIIQLFEELEESATTTIARSREHVAKQNAGKAFKMKQLMSAIEGSCLLLDSVSEHGTHRQLFTVFQKLKLQLQTYVSLINQERDNLVKTKIVMDIDHDLESLVSGFDKVGDVRLESNKVEFTRTVKAKPERRRIEKFNSDDTGARGNQTVQMGLEHLRHVEDSHSSSSHRQDAVSNIPKAKSEKSDRRNESPMNIQTMSEKETQTDLDLKTPVVSNAKRGSGNGSRLTEELETRTSKQRVNAMVGDNELNEAENAKESDSKSERASNKQATEGHSIKKSYIDISPEEEYQDVNKRRTSSNSNKLQFQQNTKSTPENGELHTVQFSNRSSKREISIDRPGDINNTGTVDLQSSILPMSSATISQFETDESIMMDVPANLLQTKEMKQDNPNRSRLCIGLCTLKDAAVLMFKVTKRTGISFNIVALDIESLDELKSVETKKDPRDLIAYDSSHFAVTFPDLGFVDFFGFKPASAIGKSKKRVKKAPNPADVWLEKSVKCDIRSAVVCRYRKGVFAVSTSNYFGTLSHDGVLTKLFYYSMSLRSVETNFWRTQLSVVKLVFDHKNDIIYASTFKPFKLFAFSLFGEVLSETVLDAAATSLQLDRYGYVYVCYNNAEDGVGRMKQVFPKLDIQRDVLIDTKNPRFVAFSQKNNHFHVVENQSNSTIVQKYELDLATDDSTGEQIEAESISTGDQ